MPHLRVAGTSLSTSDLENSFSLVYFPSHKNLRVESTPSPRCTTSPATLSGIGLRSCTSNSAWDPDATRSLELAIPVLAVTGASLYNESISALPQPPPLNDAGTAWKRLRRPAMDLKSSHNSCGYSTTATESVGDTDLASHVHPGDRVDVVPTLSVGVGNSIHNWSSDSTADAEPVDDATTDRGANAWHSPVLDPVDP